MIPCQGFVYAAWMALALGGSEVPLAGRLLYQSQQDFAYGNEIFFLLCRKGVQHGGRGRGERLDGFLLFLDGFLLVLDGLNMRLNLLLKLADGLVGVLGQFRRLELRLKHTAVAGLIAELENVKHSFLHSPKTSVVVLAGKAGVKAPFSGTVHIPFRMWLTSIVVADVVERLLRNITKGTGIADVNWRRGGQRDGIPGLTINQRITVTLGASDCFLNGNVVTVHVAEPLPTSIPMKICGTVVPSPV